MISGVSIYASYQRVSFFHATVAGIVLLALGVAVGAYVRSWWMLLALMGPLVALAYLEVSGFVGTSDDLASEPLLSPPGVFVFFIFTTILMLGYALGQGAEWSRGLGGAKIAARSRGAGSSSSR
ncbi:MAG TPA: hypothetical protein VGC63_06800 [Solirubrobacterales bacterium]